MRQKDETRRPKGTTKGKACQAHTGVLSQLPGGASSPAASNSAAALSTREIKFTLGFAAAWQNNGYATLEKGKKGGIGQGLTFDRFGVRGGTVAPKVSGCGLASFT